MNISYLVSRTFSLLTFSISSSIFSDFVFSFFFSFSGLFQVFFSVPYFSVSSSAFFDFVFSFFCSFSDLFQVFFLVYFSFGTFSSFVVSFSFASFPSFVLVYWVFYVLLFFVHLLHRRTNYEKKADKSMTNYHIIMYAYDCQWPWIVLRFSVNVLGHTPTPFLSVDSCHLRLFPGESHYGLFI